MERNKTWEKWDKLNGALSKIKRDYAKAALAAAHEVLGDDMYSDAATRLAALTYFDTGFEVSLELCRAEHKLKD